MSEMQESNDGGVDFNVHLNDIKYIVWNKLKDMDLAEKNLLVNTDILQKGKDLQQTIRELINDGQSESVETGEVFKVRGIHLICAFFLKYTSTGRPEAEAMTRYLSEKELIDAIIETVRVNGDCFWDFESHPNLIAQSINSFYETVVSGLKGGSQFREYTKMSQKQFDCLLDGVRAHIENNNRLENIPPDFRLLVALRHLVTGDSISTLSLTYLLGRSTVQGIIYETCQVIWDAIRHLYIFWPKDLRKSSESWYRQHKLPHCVGAVDGKHIRIEKPAHSENFYWNHWNNTDTYSIILMAVCDADCNFTFASIGGNGSQGNDDTWYDSSLGSAIAMDEIDWPDEEPLPDSDTPFGYFLIADNTFDLTTTMLCPYTGKNLLEDQKVFNAHLERARCTIERTFGTLGNRFRVFHQTIAATPEQVNKLLQAAVTLHNFINKTRDKETPIVSDYVPSNTVFLNQIDMAELVDEEALDYRNIYKDYLFEH